MTNKGTNIYEAPRRVPGPQQELGSWTLRFSGPSYTWSRAPTWESCIQGPVGQPWPWSFHMWTNLLCLHMFHQNCPVGGWACSHDHALAFQRSMTCPYQRKLWSLSLSYTRLQPHTFFPTSPPSSQERLKICARFFYLPSRHSVLKILVTSIFSFK